MNRVRLLLGADVAHAKGFYGEGVGVAILDSGILPHPDFVRNGNRILRFVDLQKKQGRTVRGRQYHSIVILPDTERMLPVSCVAMGCCRQGNTVDLHRKVISYAAGYWMRKAKALPRLWARQSVG